MSLESQKKLLFVNNKIIKNNNLIELHKLRHPGNEKHTYFAIINLQDHQNEKTSEKTLQEYEFQHCFQYNPRHRCAFINNTISSNGKILFLLDFNILYICLYYLKTNCSKHALEYSDIFIDPEYPITRDIFEKLNENSIKFELISDVKKLNDKNYYKFNLRKTMIWLRCQVILLAKKLNEIDVVIGGNNLISSSKNYKKSDIDRIQANDTVNLDSIKEAINFIGLYISIDLYDELKKTFNISDKEILKKTKRKKISKLIDTDDDETEEPLNKKFKKNDSYVESPMVKKPKVVNKKAESKKKEFAKAATKTKSITSFFKK